MIGLSEDALSWTASGLYWLLRDESPEHAKRCLGNLSSDELVQAIAAATQLADAAMEVWSHHLDEAEARTRALLPAGVQGVPIGMRH